MFGIQVQRHFDGVTVEAKAGLSFTQRPVGHNSRVKSDLPVEAVTGFSVEMNQDPLGDFLNPFLLLNLRSLGVDLI